MNFEAVRRWVTFFLLGIWVQGVVYILYPFLVLFFKFFIKGYGQETPIVPDVYTDIDALPSDNLRDQFFLADGDDHNALVHGFLYGLPEGKSLAEPALERLMRMDGTPKRRYPVESMVPISGDCLSSWVWAYISADVKRPDLVDKMAREYITYAMGFKHYNGRVTNRCSNGGMNQVFDGYKGIGQPCFGPQYYTSAGLLALAAKECGGMWKIAYALHWLVLGGWLWWLAPVLHSKKDSLYYAQDVTMRNLWSIQKCMGSNLMLKYAMKDILSLTKGLNPFHHALAYDVDAIKDPSPAIRVLKAHEMTWGFWAQARPASLDHILKINERVSSPYKLNSPMKYTYNMLKQPKD